MKFFVYKILYFKYIFVHNLNAQFFLVYQHGPSNIMFTACCDTYQRHHNIATISNWPRILIVISCTLRQSCFVCVALLMTKVLLPYTGCCITPAVSWRGWTDSVLSWGHRTSWINPVQSEVPAPANHYLLIIIKLNWNLKCKFMEQLVDPDVKGLKIAR